MRKLGVVVVSLMALLVVTSSAMADTTGQTFDVSLSTNKAGKSLSLKAKFQTFLLDSAGAKVPNGKPSPGTNTTVYLPSGMKVNFSKFKSCSKATLEASGATACPSGSKVGTGSASIDATPLVATPLKATVTAFSGGSGKLELFVQITSGAPTTLVLEGKLSGGKLSVNIPKLPVPGDVKISITDFQVNLNGKNFLTNPKKCSKTWTYKGVSKFEDGTTVSNTEKIKCKK